MPGSGRSGARVVAKAEESVQNRPCIIRRNGLGPDDPGIDFPVGRCEQAFELLQFAVRHVADMLLGELAHDEVHFPESATGRPELQFALSFVHCTALFCRLSDHIGSRNCTAQPFW